MLIESCTEADLADICNIERLSFPAPWTREAFAKELIRPFAQLNLLRPASGKPAIAFCHSWEVVDEVQILSIAVHPEARRQGHGGRLLADLIQRASQRHLRVITLEVRRSNMAAQALYHKFGFRDVGLRPRYYADNGEDAVLMDLELGGTS